MNRLYWPTSGSNKFTLHHSTDLGNLSSKNLLTKVCQVNAICLHEYFFLQCSLPPTCCLHHHRIFVVWIRNIEYLVLSYTLSFTISGLFHDRNCTLHRSWNDHADSTECTHWHRSSKSWWIYWRIDMANSCFLILHLKENFFWQLSSPISTSEKQKTKIQSWVFIWLCYHLYVPFFNDGFSEN